jgi:hypothetical protein
LGVIVQKSFDLASSISRAPDQKPFGLSRADFLKDRWNCRGRVDPMIITTRRSARSGIGVPMTGIGSGVALTSTATPLFGRHSIRRAAKCCLPL